VAQALSLTMSQGLSKEGSFKQVGLTVPELEFIGAHAGIKYAIHVLTSSEAELY